MQASSVYVVHYLLLTATDDGSQRLCFIALTSSGITLGFSFRYVEVMSFSATADPDQFLPLQENMFSAPRFLISIHGARNGFGREWFSRYRNWQKVGGERTAPLHKPPLAAE